MLSAWRRLLLSSPGRNEIGEYRMAVLCKCLGNAILGTLHHALIGDEEEPSVNAVARQDIR